MRLAIACLAAVLAACASTPELTVAQLERRLAETTALPGAKVRDQGTFVMVQVPEQQEYRFFTKANHAAHPGIVEVTFVVENGRATLHTYGSCGGDHEAFERFQQYITDTAIASAKKAVP